MRVVVCFKPCHNQMDFLQISSLKTHKRTSVDSHMLTGIGQELALHVQENPFHSCLFFASCLVFCNLFCKLPQNWEVWVHLCWNFPTFSFEVVVFRMYCCSFINFRDVPHNCQHKRAGERKETFNMENSIENVNVWYTQILVTFQCSIQQQHQLTI